jgi:hypothetical protein
MSALDHRLNGFKNGHISLGNIVSVKALFQRYNLTHNNHIDSFGSQLFGGWLASIAGHGADLELFGENRVREDGPDNRTTLSSSCAKHRYYFRHNDLSTILCGMLKADMEIDIFDMEIDILIDGF